MVPSAPSSQVLPPSQTILLFARGVIAILDLWPALTIAVSEQWGGPESAQKRTWMASTILDEWESRINYLTTTSPPQIDPKDADDPPLDIDDLGDMINQMMSDEFEANIEDGSIDVVANDIIQLWRGLLSPSTSQTPDSLVIELELKVAYAQRTGVQASRGADPEEGDDIDDSDSGSEDDDGMEVEGEDVPQLVPREKERTEPVVDEDGFTLVQCKGKKGR